MIASKSPGCAEPVTPCRIVRGWPFDCGTVTIMSEKQSAAAKLRLSLSVRSLVTTCGRGGSTKRCGGGAMGLAYLC